jgi:hypothetical protein
MKNIATVEYNQGVLTTNISVIGHDHDLVTFNISRYSWCERSQKPLVNSNLEMVFSREEFLECFGPFINTLKEKIDGDLQG